MCVCVCVWEVESKQHAIHYASIGGIMGAAIGRRRVEPLSSTWSFRGSFCVEGKVSIRGHEFSILFRLIWRAIWFHDPVTNQLVNKLGWLRGGKFMRLIFFFFFKGFEQIWIRFETRIHNVIDFTFTVYLYGVEFKLLFFFSFFLFLVNFYRGFDPRRRSFKELVYIRKINIVYSRLEERVLNLWLNEITRSCD